MLKIILPIIAFVILVIISVINVPNFNRIDLPLNVQEQTTPIEENDYPMEEISFFAMNTLINLKASGENAIATLQECREYIQNFENMVSHKIPTSELYRLNENNGEPMQISDEFYNIIETSLYYAEVTDGAFDITIASVTEIWDESETIPKQDAIDKALESVSYKNIVLLDDNHIQLKNDAKIELGAIGKGIATDYLLEIYEKNGIKKGIISLSGNVYLVGEKDIDTPWTIGVTDPESPTQHNISIKLTDVSVVTAGAYERYFWYDDEFYHHIFDTQTGYPSKQDITSVTVVSKNSTLADVFSTSLFVMGFENAIEFLLDNPEIDAIIINADNQVYITENIRSATTLGAKYLTF